jgi:hypothetical protein
MSSSIGISNKGKEQRMRSDLIVLAVLAMAIFAGDVQAASETSNSVMSGAIRGGIIGGVVGGIAGVVMWALKKNKK